MSEDTNLTPTLAAPRVLLVQPRASRAIVALAALGEAGCRVQCVTSGREAITRLARRDVDLAIIDAALSDCSVLELVREVRGAGVGVPLLVIGVDAVAQGIAALDAGADGFLGESLAMSELVARAFALVRRARGPGWPLERT